jgi:hypothetical protein
MTPKYAMYEIGRRRTESWARDATRVFSVHDMADDDPAFFDLVASFRTATLKEAVLKALDEMPGVEGAFVMMSMVTGEFVAGIGTGNRNGMYWDPRGFVANWEIPGGRQVRMLWRKAYGRKPIEVF